jgi:hypothetical protein
MKCPTMLFTGVILLLPRLRRRLTPGWWPPILVGPRPAGFAGRRDRRRRCLSYQRILSELPRRSPRYPGLFVRLRTGQVLNQRTHLNARSDPTAVPRSPEGCLCWSRSRLARQEADIIAASRENRIVGGVDGGRRLRAAARTCRLEFPVRIPTWCGDPSHAGCAV